MVKFPPDNGNISFLSSKDLAAYAVLDLIAAIKNPHPETPLFLGNKQSRALTQVADIFAAPLYPKNVPQNIASPRLANTQNPFEKTRVPNKNSKTPRVNTQ